MQEDRKARLEELEQLQEELSKVQKEVAQYADSDPTKVEAMREFCPSALCLAHDDAVRLQSCASPSVRGHGLQHGQPMHA